MPCMIVTYRDLFYKDAPYQEKTIMFDCQDLQDGYEKRKTIHYNSIDQIRTVWRMYDCAYYPKGSVDYILNFGKGNLHEESTEIPC